MCCFVSLCKVAVCFHCDLGLTNVLPPSPQALRPSPSSPKPGTTTTSPSFFESQGDNKATISYYYFHQIPSSLPPSPPSLRPSPSSPKPGTTTTSPSPSRAKATTELLSLRIARP